MLEALRPLILLSSAATLGAAIAWTPRPSVHEWHTIRASSLLATAGALMMLVVDGELSRAFGLVGAASIVRYRYGLRSSRDASILVLALGLGMACGSGLLHIALLGTGVLLVLLAAFSTVLPGAQSRTLEVDVRARDLSAEAGVVATLKGLGLEPRFVEAEGREPKEARGGDKAQNGDRELVHRFVWSVDMPRGLDPLTVLRALREQGFPEVRLRDPPMERQG